jgi:DNA-binding MarR family transcriptional regulator
MEKKPLRNRAAKKSLPELKLGAFATYLGPQLRRVNIAVMTELTQLLSRINLTPGQYTILVVIAANKGAKQIDIVSTMGIQKANLAPAIALLERRGLVRRALSEIDGRVHYLAITDRGKALLARATRATETIEARMLEALGSREAVEQMIRQLNAIVGALQHPAPTPVDRKMKAQAWKEANLSTRSK